jgi:uncharacterized protein YnzC (UPF0291/DUF896 family)
MLRDITINNRALRSYSAIDYMGNDFEYKSIIKSKERKFLKKNFVSKIRQYFRERLHRLVSNDNQYKTNLFVDKF